jgi:GntR family transcriptional regulator
MNLEIDFRSGLPIYLQIVERIRALIAAGRLKPGDQLPTVRALATELRVNFNTVARSYRILDESGIISTQQGRGTYILELPPPKITEGMRKKALQALTYRYLLEASRLEGKPQEISRVFQDQVTKWRKSGSLTNPETGSQES